MDRLSYASVFHARAERSQEGLQGNRDWTRNFLAMNKDSTKRLGYNLHADESAETLCVTGFDVLNGFAPGYTYSRVREAKAGIVSDDPNHGGNRLGVGAGGSGAFSDDSVQSMAFRGWFSELRADTELMPNVNNKNERHIDFIEVGELFAECVADLEDSGTPKEAIGTQVCVTVCVRVTVCGTHRNSGGPSGKASSPICAFGSTRLSTGRTARGQNYVACCGAQ